VAKLTRLKALRERKALTQQELAGNAGINRVTLARIEGCIEEPYPGTVRKLALALGVKPEDLMDPPPWVSVEAEKGTRRG
jgi:transcriptional regulator with XRE-family HTH domain